VVPAAEQHAIESYEANTLGILDPPVRPEICPPPRQPLGGDWLTGVPGIADIVIAGNCAKPHAEGAHQLGCVSQIVLDIGAVYGDVSGMNDEVGVLRGDPSRQWRPIGREMRFAPAEMRVRDLNYPHSAPHK
jgi:hypothetical protein